MSMSARRLGLAGAAVVAFATLFTVPASADWYGGGWDGGYGYHHHRHYGVGFGFSFGTPYYHRRHYYRPYYSYGYDGCYTRRRVVFNDYGERIIVRRRVCY